MAKIINRIVNGTFIPPSTTNKNIRYSCGFGDKDIIDNLAQGSVVSIAKSKIFNRKCWKCGHSYSEKGLTNDTTCPQCSQKSNNPEFPKILHESFHMNQALKFSGLAKDSPPMSAPMPRTFNHENIYHNSNKVAQASSESGNNKVYKERQQMVDKLNRILGLTYSSRGLL